VAKEPGRKYKPLFLYGGVGLGKTHLLQAVGNELCAGAPNLRMAYITSEQFTNDYVAAIKAGAMDKFKNIYGEPIMSDSGSNILSIGETKYITFVWQDRVEKVELNYTIYESNDTLHVIYRENNK